MEKCKIIKYLLKINDRKDNLLECSFDHRTTQPPFKDGSFTA